LFYHTLHYFPPPLCLIQVFSGFKAGTTKESLQE
jgi:hypothetical protein